VARQMIYRGLPVALAMMVLSGAAATNPAEPGAAATSAVDPGAAPVPVPALPAGAEVVREIRPGSTFEQLGVVQPDGDNPAAVPLGMAVLNDEIVILDNVNQRLMRVSADGKQMAVRDPLPAAVVPIDVVARSGRIFVLDGATQSVFQPGTVPPEAPADAGGRSLAEGPGGPFLGVGADGEPIVPPDLSSRAGGRSLDGGAGVPLPATQLNYGEGAAPTKRGFMLMMPSAAGRSFDEPDSAADFSVEPSAETHPGVNVVGARILWRSTDGNASDVHVQELDGTSNGIRVRTAVRRYARPASSEPGPLTFTAIAPLAQTDFGRDIVASNGVNAFQLQAVAGADGKVAFFRLLKLTLSAVPPAEPVRDAEAPPTAPVLPPSLHPWPSLTAPVLQNQAEARARRETFCARTPAAQTTQQAVLDRVNAVAATYLNVTWTVNEATTGASKCERPGDWRRAPQLNGKAPGSDVKGMPYGWGNFNTVEGFLRKVKAGARGGSVCTKAQVIENTAGIDCSGFVHRALGLEQTSKLSTRTMQGHMIDLGSYAALRPGDVLLAPGSHVMFFLGAENGGVRTVESTKNCISSNFQGVCTVLRPFETIRSYRPARAVTNCEN
jgi:cell wall-associated NlpC family hydrolase